MTTLGTGRRATTALTTVVLLVLCGLHVALFAHATLVTDSGRDLANAWAVAHGGPYPAYGPELFGVWKLGPVWFWMLAAAMRLTGSITGTAVFVGLLASAKIPLAYFLGRRMSGPQLGMLAACLIALPGWSSIGTLVIAHPCVVESALIACLLLSLRAWQRRSIGACLCACLMLALALHAHPTTLIAAPAVAAGIWKAVLEPRRFRWLVLAAGVFLLPFLPALIAEAQHGWPQAQGTLSYLHDANGASRALHLPQLAWALATGGAWFAAHFLLSGGFASLWIPVHAVLLSGAAFGGLRLVFAAHDGLARFWLALALVWSLSAMVFIALLRDSTPGWMVYCLAPFGTFLLALGWHGLISARRSATPVLAVVALFSVSVTVFQLQHQIALQASGRILLPGASIGDIKAARSQPATYSPWLSVLQFDALAEYSCRNVQQTMLHGELATVFDFSQGVAARLHCGTHPLPRLGGQAGGHHLAGLSAELAAELGFETTPRHFGHVLRRPLRVLAPPKGRVAEVDVRYRPERQAALDAKGEQTLSGHWHCAHGSMLVISNLMPMVNRFASEVRANQQPLPPTRTTAAASYYACDGQELHWRVATPDIEAADVVVLPLRNTETE